MKKLYAVLLVAIMTLAVGALTACGDSADKSALEALITQCQAVEEELYTEASFSAFSSKLDAAIVVKDNSSATQAEVDEAKSQLQTAKDDLVTIASEVEYFRNKYYSTLILTVESVQTENKTNVNNALAAYSLLDAGVKAELTEEKSKLDALKNAIAQKETAASNESKRQAFLVARAEALALEVDTVQPASRSLVEDALKHYNIFSADVKALLTEEYQLLNALLEKINLIESLTFVTTHSAALELEVATVQPTSKSIVAEALSQHDLLADGVKELLTEQKAHLDALMEKILLIEAE